MRQYKILLQLVFLFATCFSMQTKGQVFISATSIDAPMVKPEILWNVVLINEMNKPVSGNLQINITDKNNKPVFSATSTKLILEKGANALSYLKVSPIASTYNSLMGINEYLKVGGYSVCYIFNRELENGGIDNPRVTEECIDINIEAISPPLLNYPEDKSKIYELNPNFIWTSPIPLSNFDGLQYELKVFEIKKEQSLNEAIQNNSPVYVENFINSTSKLLPLSYKSLVPNAEYAWEITAYDKNYSIKSEPAQFSIIRDSVLEIIEKTPYVKMSQTKVEFGIMHQGYIKILLTNYTSDAIAKLILTEEGSSSNKPIASIDININSGVNYLLREFTTKKKLDENKIYQLVWMNSKNERWVIRYKPKYYR